MCGGGGGGGGGVVRKCEEKKWRVRRKMGRANNTGPTQKRKHTWGINDTTGVNVCLWRGACNRLGCNQLCFPCFEFFLELSQLLFLCFDTRGRNHGQPYDGEHGLALVITETRNLDLPEIIAICHKSVGRDSKPDSQLGIQSIRPDTVQKSRRFGIEGKNGD